MDYEKAYKDAVSKIKSIIADKKKQGLTNCLFEGDLNEIFPELKESDDERIRKTLREIIIDYDPNNEILIKEVGVSQKQFIAWLEKQGEQKPADKIEPKFKVGDKINRINREEEDYTILTVTSINMDEKCYICNQGSVINFDEEKEWYKIEQKPAWSEEDEKWINRACMLLDELNHLETLTLAKIPHNVDEIINHIKSLKNRVQPQWKPTDGQMQALELVVQYHAFADQDKREKIVALFNDLKKL